ncbi:MAG: type II secretion system protein M, partial [Nitrospira sp.]|nr:type II secretion system protein M [Nitrospira sp.]
MMHTLRERWHQMSSRERTIVSAGGIIAGLSLLFVLIVDPLLATFDRLERQAVRKEKDLKELTLLSQEYRAKQDHLAAIESRMPAPDSQFSL